MYAIRVINCLTVISKPSNWRHVKGGGVGVWRSGADGFSMVDVLKASRRTPIGAGCYVVVLYV